MYGDIFILYYRKTVLLKVLNPMAPLTLEVGREAEGADIGYFIFDPGYRERMSEPTTGVTFDADTISFAAGLGIGGKLDISVSESMDFVNKLSGTISRAIGKLFDD